MPRVSIRLRTHIQNNLLLYIGKKHIYIYTYIRKEICVYKIVSTLHLTNLIIWLSKNYYQLAGISRYYIMDFKVQN